MATTEDPLVIDRQAVERIVAGFALPPEIERIEVTYGPDHTGEASIFLTFYVRDDEKIDTAGLKRLSSFLSLVTSDLLSSNVGGFPYTRLEQAA